MTKKIMAILLSVILICSLGTFVMAEETANTTTYVSEEVLIDSRRPEDVITTTNYSGGSGFKGYEFHIKQDVSEDNVPTATVLSVLLQKFDLNGYVYPVDNVALYTTFRETGNGKMNVFKAPAWDTETVNWNTFGGSEFDFTPDESNPNYVGTYNGDGASNQNMTTSINITDLVNEVLYDDNPDNTLYLVYGRTLSYKDKDTGIYTDGTAIMRILADKTRLSITQSEPIHEVPSTTAKVAFSDATVLAPGKTREQIYWAGNTGSYGWFYKYEKTTTVGYVNGIANGDNGADPYGVSRCHYVKFDLSDIDQTKPIKKVTISYNAASRHNNWSVYHYLVENDKWVGVLGEETEETPFTMWEDVFPENAETGEVEPTNMAPNKSKFVFNDPIDKKTGEGGIKNAGGTDNKFVMSGPFDVTDIVKNEFALNGGDGVVSLAIMVQDCYQYTTGLENSSRGTVRVQFQQSKGPFLNIEYDDGGEVASEKEKISFKVNEAEAATLSSGVFTASTEITNTMPDDTKATLLMCVYEGNKLKDIFIKPALVNSRNKNSGKTAITVSSDKEIEVGENTKVGIYLWKDLLFPIPVNEGKVITSAQ